MKDHSRDPEAETAPKKPAAGVSAAKLAETRRLAEALRANLRRRKEQTRQRKAGGDAGPQDI